MPRWLGPAPALEGPTGARQPLPSWEEYQRSCGYIPTPSNLGALEGGKWEFSEGQTRRDWELEQLRYLPGQSRQFGNIPGGDNQTLAEPSAGGSSQSREEARHQRSCSLGFYEPGGVAGGGFVPGEDPAGSRDPLKLSPDTAVTPAPPGPQQGPSGAPLLPAAAEGVTPLGWGHPSSEPSAGGGYPWASPALRGHPRPRAALTLLFPAPGTAGRS